MKEDHADQLRCELLADYAIQDAIVQAKFGEAIVEYIRQSSKEPDCRQLHRQHCQPEDAPIDWSGIGIALFIVGVIAAIAIGSTIDFRGL